MKLLSGFACSYRQSGGQDGYRFALRLSVQSYSRTKYKVIFWHGIDQGKKTVELSGDKAQVLRLQGTVQQKLREFSDESFDLEHIKRTQGRTAYLHAFSSKPSVTAPAHWTSYQGNLDDVADIRGRLVPVSAKLRQAVSQLVTKTWSSKKVGVGNDAVNLHHRGVAVSNVWQIENASQYKRYVLHGKEAYKHNSALRVPKISGQQGEKGIKTLEKGTKIFSYVLNKSRVTFWLHIIWKIQA